MTMSGADRVPLLVHLARLCERHLEDVARGAALVREALALAPDDVDEPDARQLQPRRRAALTPERADHAGAPRHRGEQHRPRPVPQSDRRQREDERSDDGKRQAQPESEEQTRLRVTETGLDTIGWADDDKAHYVDEHRHGWEVIIRRLGERFASTTE